MSGANSADFALRAYGELTEVIEPSVTDPTTHDPVNPTYYYYYDVYGDQTSMTDAEGNVTTTDNARAT